VLHVAGVVFFCVTCVRRDVLCSVRVRDCVACNRGDCALLKWGLCYTWAGVMFFVRCVLGSVLHVSVGTARCLNRDWLGTVLHVTVGTAHCLNGDCDTCSRRGVLLCHM